MSGYTYKKEIPVTDEVEVLIVGGGSAGIAAAAAAARRGVSTMLVESYGCLGGMATTGLVGPFMTSYDATGEVQVIKGIFDELVRNMEERGGAIHPSKVRSGSTYCSFILRGHDHCTPFDPEVLKISAEEMVLKSGCRLLLYTKIIDVILDGDRITGVVAACKSGLRVIKAQIVVDCSGDADIAAMSNAPCILGAEEDNWMQPGSMFFRAGNVNSDEVELEISRNRYRMGFDGKRNWGTFHWIVTEGIERGEWDIDRSSLGMYESNVKGEWRLNISRLTGIDGTKSEDLTKASIEGRKQAFKIFEFLKKNVPGYQNSRLIDTGSSIGIRETRHIKGEYILNENDLLDGIIPEDSILMASNSVDIHAKGEHKGSGVYTTMRNGRWYGVPYRVLVPLKIENLLVAGRPVSATPNAASAIRVMPPCFGMGEAAGTAAALAIKSSTTPRSVNVKKLIDMLKEQGAFLEQDN
jgi:hypothetical protein